MEHPSSAIERFFHTFESNNAAASVAEIAAMFADVFMAGGPQGMKAVRASDFALALPKRKQLFQSLGSQSTELVSVRENRLDARYVLASTQWRMRFARSQEKPQDVVVDSAYLVDTGTETFKIVVYLAHQDIMAVLKERGILPG